MKQGDKVSFNFIGYTINGIVKHIKDSGVYIRTNNGTYFVRKENIII